MLKLCGILRSSAILGSDSPQSNNRKHHSLWVTPFIPRERPKHAIAGYLRLPRPTSAPALKRCYIGSAVERAIALMSFSNQNIQSLTTVNTNFICLLDFVHLNVFQCCQVSK